MARAAHKNPAPITRFARQKWTSTILCRVVFLAVLFALVPAAFSRAGDAPPPATSYGYFDFPTCVRYALVHSEDFLKSRIDIQVKSADLKDAHSEILPTLQIITRYYLQRASSTSSNGGLSIQMMMTNWDPYLALIKMKSYGILVDIGKISHYEKISDNIAKMAKIFYRISVLEKAARGRKQVLALHESRVNFAKTRQDQGGTDALEMRSLINASRGEQLKIKSLEQETEERIGQLKILMGYPPEHYLPLDTRDAANQIFTGFNGQMVTFAEIQGDNLNLKALAKQEQLQSNRVTGAYVSLIPKPLFVLEQVENQVDRTSGFNLALGFDYTLWDGFRRVREIKRQKLKAEQVKIDRMLMSQRLFTNFKRLKSELDVSGEKEGFQREQARLAEMAEEKSFLQYKAGEVPYDYYMLKRIEKVEAQINSLNVAQERVEALIDLATIAGGLNKYNAGIKF